MEEITEEDIYIILLNYINDKERAKQKKLKHKIFYTYIYI